MFAQMPEAFPGDVVFFFNGFCTTARPVVSSQRRVSRLEPCFFQWANPSCPSYSDDCNLPDVGHPSMELAMPIQACCMIQSHRSGVGFGARRTSSTDSSNPHIWGNYHRDQFARYNQPAVLSSKSVFQTS